MGCIFYSTLAMRIFIISSLLLVLSSCSLPFGKNTETNTGATAPSVEAPMVEKVVGANNLVSLNYTLTDVTDGKILETTVMSVAQANGLYQTGATYQPFQVMIGTNSVIPGFEKGLLGLKKGEKKVIRVSPEEGYGTGARLEQIAKYQVAPVFTIKQPRALFQDVVVQTVSKEEVNDEMKAAQVGQVLTGANGAKVTVLATTATGVTVELENVDNPFYKKTIAVGATVENEATIFKITEVSDTEVSMEVTNKQSPFYNKEFIVGTTLDLPQGGKVSVVEIGEETVTIGQEHPMMGKTLEFDVEVVDIQ